MSYIQRIKHKSTEFNQRIKNLCAFAHDYIALTICILSSKMQTYSLEGNLPQCYHKSLHYLYIIRKKYIAMILGAQAISMCATQTTGTKYAGILQYRIFNSPPLLHAQELKSATPYV